MGAAGDGQGGSATLHARATGIREGEPGLARWWWGRGMGAAVVVRDRAIRPITTQGLLMEWEDGDDMELELVSQESFALYVYYVCVYV